jgi:hypothetical protein
MIRTSVPATGRVCPTYPPAADEPLDPAWRPIHLSRDSFEEWEAKERVPWPQDRSVLCWWLPIFWRRGTSSDSH